MFEQQLLTHLVGIIIVGILWNQETFIGHYRETDESVTQTLMSSLIFSTFLFVWCVCVCVCVVEIPYLNFVLSGFFQLNFANQFRMATVPVLPW